MASAGFLAEFGAAVRRLREQRSMTQGELAARVGLGRTSMTNLERGKQNPPLSLLPELARALGVSASELLADAMTPAVQVDDEMLAGQVQDDELRRWATQVIVDRPKASTSAQVAPRHRAPRGDA